MGSTSIFFHSSSNCAMGMFENFPSDQVWTGRKQMTVGTTEIQTGCRSAGRGGRRWRRGAGEDAVLLGRPRAPVRSSGPGAGEGAGGLQCGCSAGASSPPTAATPPPDCAKGSAASRWPELRAGGGGGRLQPRDARCDFPGVRADSASDWTRRLAPSPERPLPHPPLFYLNWL